MYQPEPNRVKSDWCGMGQRGYGRALMANADELSRRLRAARAYKGLSKLEMATALGMSESTYKRIETGTKGFEGWQREGFLAAIADATGMPRGFFNVDVPLEAAFATDFAATLEAFLRALAAAAQAQRQSREATSSADDEQGPPDSAVAGGGS